MPPGNRPQLLLTLNLSRTELTYTLQASDDQVAVQNLWLRGKEASHRGWLTFDFGQVHGFDFAIVLRDLGAGAHGERIALLPFSFNLGVEAGQVCVAAVVMPILALFLRKEKIRRVAVRTASAVVTAAGHFWLVERTILA